MGLTTLGYITNQSQWSAIAIDADLHRFRFKWTDVENTLDVFDFTYIKSQMDIPYTAGKFIQISFIVSPNTTTNDAAGWAGNNAPKYLFDAGVQKVFTDRSPTTYYPYYENAYFKTRVFNLIDHWVDYLATLPLLYRQKIVIDLSTEYKTGDEGPYAGTPLNPAYNISLTQQDTYRRSIWAYLYTKFSTILPTMHLMINQGNDGRNFLYGLTNYAGVNFKAGNFTHNFGLPGSLDYSNRLNSLRNPSTDPPFEHVVGGEWEGTQATAGYSISPKRVTYQMMCENLHANVSYINLALSNWLTDKTAYRFFNKYAGIRNVSDTNVGFSKCNFRIDVGDTALFSEGTYGVLIDPDPTIRSGKTRKQEYDQKYSNIVGNPSLTDAEKSNRITSLKIDYVNPARLSALQAAYPSASFQALNMDNSQDMYTQDITMDGLSGNYEQYLYQINPRTTTTAKWRYGPTDDFYGLTALLITNEGFWWTPLITGNNYQTKIKVVYYDDSGTFGVYYHNGSIKTLAQTITKGGTNRYKSVEVTINNLQGGRLLANSSDFTVKNLTGAGTIVDTVEFTRVAQNTTGANAPPVANAGMDQSITLPTNSATVNAGSSFDTDGTITSYLWTQVSGPNTATITIAGGSSTLAVAFSGNTASYRYAFTLSGIPVSGDIVNVEFTYNPNNIDPPTSHNVSSTVIDGWSLNDLITDLYNKIFAINPNTNLYTDGDGNNGVSTRGFDFASGSAEVVQFSDGTGVIISDMIEGIYVFRVTVTDDDGDSDTDDITITVNPDLTGTPQPPFADAGTDIYTTTTATQINLNSSLSFDNDGTIVSRLWTQISGPNVWNIADPTLEIAVATPAGDLIAGTEPDVFEVLITDNDGLTDTDTVNVFVTLDASLVGNLPRKKWLYFLAKKTSETDYTTLYWEDEVVKDTSAKPKPLIQHPSGWKDIQISFGTNQKYFSLNRSFTIPLKFINDGANILRWYSYQGKGYEEELYIILAKWNRDNGIHELEYRGKIDMSKFDDSPVTGVTVNSIEGGALALLNANDTNTLEIICDETNPDAIQIQFDGVTLQDTYHHSIIETDFDLGVITDSDLIIPTVFLTNDGDSVGVIRGDQNLERIDDIADYVASGNYLFNTVFAINNLTISGKIITDNLPYNGAILIRTSKGNTYTLLADGFYDNFSSFDFSATFNLAANEKFFLVAKPDVLYNLVKIKTSDFIISFVSKNAPSKAYGILQYQFLKQLWAKLSGGKYAIDSNFLRENNHIAVTCGDSLRNTDKTSENSPIKNYIVACSFQDFFNDLSAVDPLTGLLEADFGIKVIDDIIWVEPKKYLYKDDAEIFDLGEVSELKISVAEEYLVNTINAGYPDQRYDQRNGKYEFNSTQQYSLPVTAVKKSLDIVCKSRSDPFGIEFIRGLSNKDTTDNTGDKTMFRIDVDTSSSSIITMKLTANKDAVELTSGKQPFDTIINAGNSENYIEVSSLKDDFTYINTVPYSMTADVSMSGSITGMAGGYAVFELRLNGVALGSRTIPVEATIFHIAISSFPSLQLDDFITVYVTMTNSTVTLTSGQLNIFNSSIVQGAIYNLYREAYTELSGVLDNTIFNVRLSPHRQVLGHGAYLKSLLYLLQSEEIIFNTGAKNTQLVTTIGGVTIAENANIPVSSLPDPIFLPFKAKFKGMSPYTFSKTMAHLGTGYVKIAFNGHDIYTLPIGQMSAKPATDEPQEWDLLLAPKTNIATLLLLQSASLLIENSTSMIKIFNICPVHFVKYNYTPPAKYHHKEIHEDWAHQRFDRWSQHPAYLQKWQTTDPVIIPVITAGVGQLSLFVYDKTGKDYTQLFFNIVGDAVIQLPFVLQIATIDLSTFEEGQYLFVIKSDAETIAISEWQDIKEDHPNTYCIEVSNTYNKFNYYKSWGTLTSRVEAMFLPWYPESSFTDYEDEPKDIELLDGIGTRARKLLLGPASGFPEYMAIMLNEMLLLNRVSIEGSRYTRTADSKLEVLKPEDKGWPFYYCSIEVAPAKNQTGITFDSQGNEIIPLVSAYTLDAQAFGLSDETIDITVEDE